MTATPSLVEKATQAAINSYVESMASQVANNQQLRNVIHAAKPELRKAVYERILPHLCFRPAGYNLLMMLKA